MKAITRFFSGKFIAAAVVLAGLSLSATPTQAAPPAIQTAGIREYHHHHEMRVTAEHLHVLRYRVAEAMNFGWVPVGGAFWDGFAWVQVMVRD